DAGAWWATGRRAGRDCATPCSLLPRAVGGRVLGIAVRGAGDLGEVDLPGGGGGLVLLAPVVGQHVVEHVVDGHSAQQTAVLVDHGDRDQVVGGHLAGDGGQRHGRRHRDPVRVEDLAHGPVGTLPQQLLEVDDPQQLPGGSLQRRAAHVHRRGERG